MDLRHPLFVQLVTTVHLGQATLNRVLWEHSIMAAGLITLRTVLHVHLAGKDVYHLDKIILSILRNAQSICHNEHCRFCCPLCERSVILSTLCSGFNRKNKQVCYFQAAITLDNSAQN